MKKNATKTAMQDLLMIFILASASANLLAQEGKLSASTLAPMPPMGCVDLQNVLTALPGPSIGMTLTCSRSATGA